jgi:hypothetical protein
MYSKIEQGKFTQCQLDALKSTKPGGIVKDIRTLRKLSKLGVVTLHEHTGEVVKHVWGMLIRAFYIDDAETFEVESVGIFHAKYFSGCLFPFLIKSE